MSESLWVIPDVSTVKTPLSILREQANQLTQQTGGLLRGDVAARPWNGSFSLSLRIIVPALENYMVELLTYDQPLKLYPGSMDSDFYDDVVSWKVENEDRFVSALRAVLSSRKTREVLSALLAQARAN